MQADRILGPDESADRFYFDRLAAGEFMIPQCVACNRHHFFPRVICPYCGSAELRWVAASGRGTVYSTTVVRRRDGDYNVCLVDLDEGPRMMSRVEGIAPTEVRIGLRVTARISKEDSSPLLVFSPAEQSA